MQVKIGTVVGNLTVESDSGLRKNGYIVWKCRCKCGNVMALDTRALQRGSILDCGCITKTKRRIKDISNQRFGRLTAIKPTTQHDKSGNILWKCRCDCGKICYISGLQMRKGYVKSCGCLAHPPIKDWIGKRFGKLVVTKYMGKESGIHHWKCQCDCGKETIVSQSNLQHGHTKSCGCLQAKSAVRNLRLIKGTSVTKLETTKGRLYKSNTSGFNGVYYSKRNKKWVAQISFRGKTYYLGEFEKEEDAIECRQEAEDTIYGSFLQYYYSEIEGKEEESAVD